MCGITGYFCDDLSALCVLYRDALPLANDQLIHRGPDGGDTWFDSNNRVGLGHRRLAIIDVSDAGLQPMASNDGLLQITYNGEIYNASVIRRELIELGYTFKSTTDTEVIVNAVSAWGLEPAVKKLVGMFAFAVWDSTTNKLSLVRDRLGIKPIYWSWENNNFVFASELQAIKKYPEFKTSFSKQAVSAYLKYGYVPAPYSIYSGVNKLPAGSILEYSGSSRPEVRSYWSLSAVVSCAKATSKSVGPSEAAEYMKPLLEKAVKERMISDVPIGAFLSGGIDSSAVVSMMQSSSTKPVRTFSIGFNEANYSEAIHAKKVAGYLGTDHTEYYLGESDLLDLVPNIGEVYGEPFADSSQIPTQILSRLTRKSVTVALSGDGGDEVFAGYNRYFWAKKTAAFRRSSPAVLRQCISRVLHSIPNKLLDSSAAVLARGNSPSVPASRRIRKFTSMLLVDDDQRAYDEIVQHIPQICPSSWGEPLPAYLQAAELSDCTAVEKMQFLDMATYLPDDILTKVDRASMKESLEVRVPLLDHRVVEASWNLTQDAKLQGGIGKKVLRDILASYLPASLFERPKMGFAIPLDKWLLGDLKDWVEDLLYSNFMEEMGLDAMPVRYAWEQHKRGKENRADVLWTVVMLGDWYFRNR